VCSGLGFLGVGLASANETLSADGIISPPRVVPAVVVVHAREDIEIAQHVREMLA
jgi:acetate kinase